MVGEARQREQQTQFAVVIFGGAELLQGVQTLNSLLHSELQLKTQGSGESESHLGSWKVDCHNSDVTTSTSRFTCCNNGAAALYCSGKRHNRGHVTATDTNLPAHYCQRA